MTRLIATMLPVGAFLAAFCAAAMLGRAPAVSAIAEPPSQASGSPTPLARPFLAVGTAGCSSAACHGGNVHALGAPPDPHCWSFAATLCLNCDPHRHAYEALSSDLASRIMKQMKSPVKASEDVRCLACHTNPSLAKPVAELLPHEAMIRQEGVGCEGCHGNGEKYLRDHTTWTESGRGKGYQSSGMTPLYDLGERAMACAGCHVGAPADPSRGYPVPRDMNHDMIAAGHPRLHFDFAGALHRMTSHWFEGDRTTGQPAGPEFELKAWLVGRAAHAEAAASLAADRAARAASNDLRTPWPEFADFSCASCHHALGRGFPRNTGKLASQNIWPITESPQLVGLARFGAIPKLDSPSAAAGFANLRKSILQTPDTELGPIVVELLKSSAGHLGSLDRDRACQVYSGLAAAERMRVKREIGTAYDPRFDALSDALRESRGSDEFTIPPNVRNDLNALLNRLK